MPSVLTFSTRGLPERERVGSWVEWIRKTIIAMAVDARQDDPFGACAELHRLGPLGAHFLAMSGHRAYRTGEMVSRKRPGQIFVQQVRQAPMRFRQSGRELEVRPGECALIDGREAYWMEYDKRNSALGFSLPQDWLTTWLPDAGAIRPQVLQPGHGWGGVLANSLGCLTPEDIRQMSPGGMSLFADHLGSLLALVVGEGALRDLGTARTVLLDRMRDTIRGTYYDAALTPAAVADQHGVSVRFLHLLFAKAGSSFGRELLTRRLEAAHRMLRDPRFGDLAVSEIALRNGFRNASHFARHFRKRFGMSPLEARARPTR